MEDNNENEVKEPAPKYEYISPDEYLEMDQASEVRLEYYDGHVIELNGASFEHGRIEINLILMLGGFLRGKQCSMLGSHMRIGSPNRKNYMYADLLVYCGNEQMEEGKFDTLVNPILIIEILSPSTQGMDKKRKFLFYSEIPSLKEYLMIDSGKRQVIIRRKQADNTWNSEEINDKEGTLLFESLGYHLPLPEIYRDTGL
jgi:Uma2 family endonuclease